MKIDTKTIVVAAVTIALTITLGYFPFVFLIPLLFTCCTRGLRMSLFMGLVFGVVSFCYSLMGGTIIAVAFVKAPYIAIIPRIFVGLFGHGAFTLSKKLFKGNGKVSLVAPYAIGAAAGTLSNTAMVVSLLVLIMPNVSHGDLTILAFVPTMLIFGLIELAIAIIIIPPLCLGVQRALNRGRSNETTVLNQPQ